MLVFSRSCEISTLVELFNIEFYRGKSPRFDLAINGHEDKRSLSITESRVTINIEQIINIVDLRKIFFSIKNLDLNFYRFFFFNEKARYVMGFYISSNNLWRRFECFVFPYTPEQYFECLRMSKHFGK